MLPGQTNDDFTLAGSVDLQKRKRKILHDYKDIFSFNVKGKAMSVPPMEFTVDAVRWEAPANRSSYFRGETCRAEQND